MTHSVYWGRILSGGSSLGGGFLLTAEYFVTAAHCVDEVADSDSLVISFGDDGSATAELIDVSRDLDVALLRVDASDTRGISLPFADRCCERDCWFAPFRPELHEPHLAGDVTAPSTPLRNASGEMINVAQLRSTVVLGDYSGYSGGPVEKHESAAIRSVYGLLVEQAFDRQDNERASNVVFAATIAHIMHALPQISVGGQQLVEPPSPRNGIHERFDALKIVLEYLQEFQMGGLIEPQELSPLRIGVVRGIIEASVGEVK